MRATSVGIPCIVLTDIQPLPDLRQFYNLTDNKKGFQNFFVNYCIAHYKSTKPLYIAGGLTDDPDKCTVISIFLVVKQRKLLLIALPTKKLTTE